MVAAALAADTRAELTTACRALDRVLRAGRYWIPMWSKAAHWLAYWDMYGRPATKPKYDRGVPATWWYEEEKAKRIGMRERGSEDFPSPREKVAAKQTDEAHNANR